MELVWGAVFGFGFVFFLIYFLGEESKGKDGV